MLLSDANRLISSAALLGVPIEGPQAEALLRLLQELELWNRSFNLTRITGRPAMIAGHLLDSLAASNELRGTRITDLGTGAGFPGLPLAILHPEREFTLIDGTAKKIRFVEHALRVLALSNVHALHVRAEKLQPERPFDTILARAVAPLPELARLARPLAAAGTRLIAYKGRHPKAELAELAERGAGWQLEGVRELTVPGIRAERCLVTLLARDAPRGAPAVPPAG
ncbi:MAG TPA: 16S rRNA (guanine(527)-N(7))-methyltransferase RsmG [Steroidobacteraceae bacterium]|nr:16S rRNA (guanine(527)-N(7))-methyltransferase RsmG [Steroidobacteraceae bacterium]